MNFWVFDGVIHVIGRSREEYKKYPKTIFEQPKYGNTVNRGNFERKGNFEHRSNSSYNSVCYQDDRTYHRVRHISSGS